MDVGVVIVFELKRMELVKEESQQIGHFLEWLISKYSMFRKDVTKEGLSQDINNGDQIVIEKLLAEYFDIDLKKIEKEKRNILNSIQNQNLKTGKCRCCGKDTRKDNLQVCDKCANEFKF